MPGNFCRPGRSRRIADPIFRTSLLVPNRIAGLIVKTLLIGEFITLKLPLSILMLAGKLKFHENMSLWTKLLLMFDVEVVAYGATCMIVSTIFLYNAWSRQCILKVVKRH